MEFTFESQGTNTYLVYTLKGSDVLDTMSLGMLTNNKILGLASTQFTQMDNTKYIKYNVSAHISVKQFFSGPVNKKRLIGVFKGIVNAMLSAEDYMIDSRSILMDMEYIFADVSTCETVLICLPIAEVEQHPIELGSFFKDIVFSTQFDQTENCDYVAKIINYLNSSPVFSLNDFKEILESIDTAPNKQQAQQRVQPVAPPIAQSQVVVSDVKTSQTNTLKNQNIATPHVEQAEQKIKSAPTVVPIPNMPKAPITQTTSPKGEPVINTEDSETGEKMSMLYLLQHYNKENAAIYKAQKEAKKGKKVTPTKSNNIGSFTVPGAPIAPPVPQNIPPVPQTHVSAPSAQKSHAFPVPGQYPSYPMHQSTPPQSNAINGVRVDDAQNVTQPVATSISTPVVQQSSSAPQGQPMSFGETTVLGGGGFGETTVLSASTAPSQVTPYLVRSRNNEKISLNKPVFRIGKEKSYVDYFIGDNTAISRSHANFITRDGEYFVLDTNSTNHTYVNGNMIQSNIEFKLSNGDKIRLANEDFEFKLY